MVFINKFSKEDLQDDTLGALKVILQSVVDAQYRNDARTMFKGMDAFYCLLWARMKNDKSREHIEKELEALADLLFTGRSQSCFNEAKAYEKARALWKDMTKQLNDMGLLFKLFTDVNELVTQRSDQ